MVVALAVALAVGVDVHRQRAAGGEALVVEQVGALEVDIRGRVCGSGGKKGGSEAWAGCQLRGTSFLLPERSDAQFLHRTRSGTTNLTLYSFMYFSTRMASSRNAVGARGSACGEVLAVQPKWYHAARGLTMCKASSAAPSNHTWESSSTSPPSCISVANDTNSEFTSAVPLREEKAGVRAQNSMVRSLQVDRGAVRVWSEVWWLRREVDWQEGNQGVCVPNAEWALQAPSPAVSGAAQVGPPPGAAHLSGMPVQPWFIAKLL